MQMKIPRFQLAHLGSATGMSDKHAFSGHRCLGGGSTNVRLFRLQSAQLLLPSSFNSLIIVCWFCAARSAAGLGARRDMTSPRYSRAMDGLGLGLAGISRLVQSSEHDVGKVE